MVETPVSWPVDRCPVVFMSPPGTAVWGGIARGQIPTPQRSRQWPPEALANGPDGPRAGLDGENGVAQSDEKQARLITPPTGFPKLCRYCPRALTGAIEIGPAFEVCSAAMDGLPELGGDWKFAMSVEGSASQRWSAEPSPWAR